jgi:hypothetical protein
MTSAKHPSVTSSSRPVASTATESWSQCMSMSKKLQRQLIVSILLAIGSVALLITRLHHDDRAAAPPEPSSTVSTCFRLFFSNKPIEQTSGSQDLGLEGLNGFAPNWSLGIFPKGASSFVQITMLRAIYEATNQTIDWTAVESQKEHVHLLRPSDILRGWPPSLFIPFFHLGGANFDLYNQEEALRNRVYAQLQAPLPAKIVSTFRDPREQAVSLHSWMNRSLPFLRRKSQVGTNFWQLLVQYQALGSVLTGSTDFQESEVVVLNSHMLSTDCTRLIQVAFRTAEMNFIALRHIQRACQWALSRGTNFSKVLAAGATWHQHPLAWEMSCVAEQLVGPPFVNWQDWWAYPGSHSASKCNLAVATDLFRNYTLWLQ